MSRLLLPFHQSSSFVPSDLDGLLYWMRADAAQINSGSPTDGDEISTWVDKSANSNDFTESGSPRPAWKDSIINSKPVTRYAQASSERIQRADSINAATSGLIAIVFNLSSLPNNGTLISTASTAGTVLWWRVHVDIATTPDKLNISSDNFGSTHSCHADTTSISTGTTYKVIITSDGATYTHWSINDTDQTLSGDNNGRWWGDIPSRNNWTFGVLRRSTFVNYLDGDIAEVIACSDENSNNVSKLQSYFASRYG